MARGFGGSGSGQTKRALPDADRQSGPMLMHGSKRHWRCVRLVVETTVQRLASAARTELRTGWNAICPLDVLQWRRDRRKPGRPLTGDE